MKKLVIDWELGQKLAGNNLELAKEMMKDLLGDLPNHLKAIQQAHQQNDLDALKGAVHHLHGALCYCGTPSLKEAARNLEIAVIEKQPSLASFYQTLLDEIAALRNETI